VLNRCETTEDAARTSSASSLTASVLFVALTMMAACSTHGTAKTPDAGKAGADGGGGSSAAGADGSAGAGGASADAVGDASLEATPTDAADAAAISDAPGDVSRTCLPDGGTAGDPLEGTWVDTTTAERWVVSNGAGCSVWLGRSADGALCDSCFGSYTVTGSNKATLTLTCTKRGSCSTSPDHVDVGLVTVSGCSLKYDYDFGGGGSTSTVTKLEDVPRDICPADASAGN
jgi:hypothetical protein